MLVPLRTAAAGAATLALLGLAGPVEARGSLRCFAEVPGVTSRGVPTTFRFDDGKAVSERRGPDALGYQPRDVAYPHGGLARLVTARPAFVTSHWFTLSGDELREVTEVDRRNARGLLVSAEYTTRVVRRHWDGVRQISVGRDRDYLYALTNTDQLLRYRLTGKNGDTSAKFSATVGIGFGTIGTLQYTRTELDDGVRSDVFLATDAETGELLEISVPLDDPAAYTRTVLVASGWADLVAVSRTASCLNPRSGRSYDGIVTVNLHGTVRLWTDRNARDGQGDDIVRRGVLASAWKPMPYSD